jgi:hypothetical protein
MMALAGSVRQSSFAKRKRAATLLQEGLSLKRDDGTSSMRYDETQQRAVQDINKAPDTFRCIQPILAVLQIPCKQGKHRKNKEFADFSHFSVKCCVSFNVSAQSGDSPFSDCLKINHINR